ncbi:MAG TPA: DUF2877 domain-containing protein [Thermodesulfobacteriota bacterium]
MHSAYARTINLEIAGGRLVSLHGPGPVLSPFGLECAERLPFSAASTGRAVWSDGRALWVEGSDARLGLHGAARWDPALPTSRRADADAAASRLRAIASAARDDPGAAGRGLLPLLPRLLGLETCAAAGTPPWSPVCERALPALERLIEGGRTGTVSALLDAAETLLGLGPGLTPSGDDALVGYVAALWTAGPSGRALVRDVAAPLAELAAARTTRLSREILGCAARGLAAEPLGRLARRGDVASVAGLLACGATSGGDCLVGWAAGLQASPARGAVTSRRSTRCTGTRRDSRDGP